MHREISHSESTFGQQQNLTLYLFTALLGLLMALDLLPLVGGWLGLQSFVWPREIFGYRFAWYAAVIGGARVVYTSLLGLNEGKIGADVALAIACVAAIMIREPLVAAEVVVIGMVGECLEAITFDRTRKAIRKIAEVCPYRCWLLRDGKEVRVLTSEVVAGDRVVVKPGAKVPVDGVVVAGRSAVDVSALTGESMPVDKAPGDEILAGSLNSTGALTIEAVCVGANTVAGQVIEMTARALKDKAGIERTADRLARYFLPVVLGLALITFLAGLLYHGTGLFKPAGSIRLAFWAAVARSVYPTLSVLVVACPCALILATPAAVIAALGRLAGTGVLIKSGSALERLAQVKVFAFDKTGTISEGRLELGDVRTLGGVSEDELLRWAASAEQGSEHPLAQLILKEAAARQLVLEPIIDFQAQPGAGVLTHVGRGPAITLLVGSRRLLEENSIPLSPEALALIESFDAVGQTPLLVAKDGVILGGIGARDRLRPEAGEVLAELRSLGVEEIVLLTGDRAAAAHSLADDLGFTAIHAELLPQQKAEWILASRGRKPPEETARESGGLRAPLASRCTAMVGDGINDAPALAQADVGLAIGGGTDIAAEAGDVILMGGTLKPIPLLVRLSRQTVRIIRQNIIWFAFVFNAIGIIVTAWLWPLFAAPGWYEQSPLAAVIYHQIGSLAVLLNAMRLLWFERIGESPRWRRIDDWLEKHLDIGEYLHWFEHRWRGIVTTGSIAFFVVWAWSGVTIIAPDEVAVLRRFGDPQANLEPGWYWRWPWPIEDVVRVSLNIQTVEVGYRESSDLTRSMSALTWSSAHRREGRLPKESLMITGEGNLIDVQAIVRFKVVNAQVYLFEVSDAPELLRATTESVLRATIAGRPFLGLLTLQRGKLQEDVLARLQKRCQELHAQNFGIEIVGLSLLDLHPPAEVVGEYYEVAKAMEDRDRSINEAQKDAIKKIKGAEADGIRKLAVARAVKTERVTEARREYARFAALVKARSELSFGTELALRMDSLDAVLKGQESPSMEAFHKRVERYRALQPSLVDFRIFWDGVSKALVGRDLVLIDSDKVPGQRTFMLIDPESLRPPPIFFPQERPVPAKQQRKEDDEP